MAGPCGSARTCCCSSSGALQALIGTFQFSRGPAWSLVAICFDLAILATCVLGSWGMRSAAGGVLPAAGWFLVTSC